LATTAFNFVLSIGILPIQYNDAVYFSEKFDASNIEHNKVCYLWVFKVYTRAQKIVRKETTFILSELYTTNWLFFAKM